MKTIFLNSGIGDFLAIQEYIPTDVSHIIFGTAQHKQLEQILRALPFYSFTSESPWQDWSAFRSFPWPGRMIEKLGLTRDDWQHVEDWSLAKTFNRIDNHEITRVSPSYLDVRLAEPPQLPEPYAVISPMSQNPPQRAFDLADWEATMAYLSKHKLTGVVLGLHPQPVPQLARLIDLTGQTTILQAIEITKGANAYLGVDSCLSVAACRVLPPQRLRIKTSNDQYLPWASVYCFPHRSFPFISERIIP